MKRRQTESTRHRAIRPLDDWEHLARRIVDLGLIAVLFITPLVMGGRGPTGRLLFVGSVLITATAWLFCQVRSKHAAWHWSGGEFVLGTGLLVMILQLAPLPGHALTALSPKLAELLPVFSSEGSARLGGWSQLSISPQDTRDSLAVYLAYAALFLVTFQRVKTRREVEHVLQLVAVAAVVMAAIGLGQFLFGNGRFLWVYDHPFRSAAGVVKGPFQAQQHFAQFLILGIGPLVWWIHHASTRPTSQQSFQSSHRTQAAREFLVPALWIGLATTVFAILLTYSRGAFLATAAALVTCLAIVAWKSLLNRQAILTIVGLALVLGAGLAIYGHEKLSTRLVTLTESSSLAELSVGRKELWEAHAKAIPQFPIVGSGAGTHRFIYPTYLDMHFPVVFTHGENGPLQVALETGLVGCVILAVGILLALQWSVVPLLRSSDRAVVACSVAVLPGLVGSLVQSLGDFIWYIPASITPLIILLACGNRLCQWSAQDKAADADSRDQQTPDVQATMGPGRLAWAAACGLMLVTSLWAVNGRSPAALASAHWDDFRLAKETVESDPNASREDVAKVVRHLEALLRQNPGDAQANAYYAIYALRLFDLAQEEAKNPLPLSQIRDAALASQFPSREALDAWLAVAVGDNRRLLDRALARAHRAATECPFQGEAYVCLAELSFLRGPHPDDKLAYIDQALLVRPHSGLVLFAAGKERALVGELPTALAYWKQAFHQDPTVHAQLLPILGMTLDASSFLKHFEPDAGGLQTLSEFYRAQARRDDARVVDLELARHIAGEVNSARGSAAARLWGRLAAVHERLGDSHRAIHASREAIQFDRNNVGLRVDYARRLSAARRHSEALEQLQWCIRRQPQDASLRSLWEEATRSYLDAGTTSATRPAPPQLPRR